MAKSKAPSQPLVADNRKARFNYHLEEQFEAGLVLTGTEVKSLRAGEANIAESFAEIKNREAWLINAYIKEFSHGNRFNHGPRRPRKLLLHTREINKMMGAVEKGGMTLVPLRLYFNAKGIAKIVIALARGKKLHDKREDQKQKDWSRQKQRLMKDYG